MPILNPEHRAKLEAMGLDPDRYSVGPDAAPAAEPTPAAAPQDASSAAGAFGRSVRRGLIPSLGAALGGAGGYALATPFAPETGGLSYLVPLVASLIGGTAGSMAAQKGQDVAVDALSSPEAKAKMDRQAAADQEQHPVASTLGGVASAIPSFELAPGASVKGLTAAYKLARGTVPAAEREAAMLAAKGVGANLGLGAATGVINPLIEGRSPTLEDVGMGAGQALLFGRHRGELGKIPGLGFMAHPEAPVDTFNPQATSQSDQPMGPQEPLGTQIDRSLGIGEQPSAMSRLYAQRYAGRLKPELSAWPGEGYPGGTPNINLSDDIVGGKLPVLGNSVVPDLLSTRKKTWADNPIAQGESEVVGQRLLPGTAESRPVAENIQDAEVVPPKLLGAPAALPELPKGPDGQTEIVPLSSADVRNKPAIQAHMAKNGDTVAPGSGELQRIADGTKRIGDTAPNPISVQPVKTGVDHFVESSGVPAMQQGKLRKTLNEPAAKRTGGKIYQGTRAEIADQMMADGFQPKAESVDAIKEPSRTQWNRMDGREQAQFEKRKAEAGSKTEYRMEHPDGRFFVVTKSEHDYASRPHEQKPVGEAGKPEPQTTAPTSAEKPVVGAQGVSGLPREGVSGTVRKEPSPNPPAPGKAETPAQSKVKKSKAAKADAKAEPASRPTEQVTLSGETPTEVKRSLAKHLESEIAKYPEPEFTESKPATYNGKKKLNMGLKAGDKQEIVEVREGFGNKWDLVQHDWNGASGKREEKILASTVGNMGDAKALARSTLEGMVHPERKIGQTITVGKSKFTVEKTYSAMSRFLARVKSLETNAGTGITIQKEPISDIDKANVQRLVNEGGGETGLANEKYQLAALEAEQRPPEQLLSHPANRDLLAALERIAAKHNITLKNTDEHITTTEGALAAGVADIQQRLAKFRGSLATVDTGLHEIAHVFLDDLRTSSNPAERAMYDRAVQIFSGNEERLVQAVGIRGTDLLKNRIEGNTLARFKAWAGDFWSWVKQKWGKANAQDLTNLMARRIVDGEAVARGERQPLSAQDNLRYQPAAVREQEARDNQRSDDHAKDVAERDLTLPIFRAAFDRVERLPGGKPLADAFRGIREMYNHVVGTFENGANRELNKVTKRDIDAIRQRLSDEDEGKTSTVQLSPKAEDAYQKVKAGLQDFAKLSNAEGIKINGDREILIKNAYLPHVLTNEARYVLTEKPNSKEFNALRDAQVKYWMEGGKKGAEAAMSEPAALAKWKDYVDTLARHSSKQGEPEIEPHFAALEKAEGLGLAPELRQTDLRQILHSYYQRGATMVAYHHFISGDHPGNDVVRGLLNRADENGKFDRNATQGPDGSALPNLAGQTDVKDSFRDIFRNYDQSDRGTDSLNRLFKSAFLQTFTGAYHATSATFIPLQHIGIMEHLALFPKALGQLGKGIDAAYRRGVLQIHANRLETTLEGGVSDRIGKAANFMNEAADLITKITGRDSLIKFARGMSMMEGMLKGEAAIGRLQARNHDKNDVQWMDSFAGKGNWERQIMNEPNLSNLIESMAAKFTESVQGGYSAEHLPGWMLSGRLAPWFSLAKFSVDRFNNFQKVIVNPMVNRGDFAPFLRLTVGALLGGTVLNALKDAISGRKPQDATWQEIAAAGGDGLPYKLLATLVHTGYAGIFTDLVKQGFDVAHGERAQGFSFPLISGIQTFANRGTQFMQALQQGENVFEMVPTLANTLAKDTTQMYRALAHFVSEDEARAVEKSNALRDLRTFRQMNGYPVQPQDANLANPFLNPLKRQFQQTDDVGEAVKIAPQLIQQAIERSGNDPERLKALLNNDRGMASDQMPSMTAKPQEFAKYLQWLNQTQGPEAAQAAMVRYQRKQMMDQAKGTLIPRL